MRLVRRVGRQVVPLVVLALLVTAGLILYHGEREGRERSYSVGADAPNRLDIAVTIERMDPVSQRLTLQLLPIARGDLTVEQNSLIPTRQLTVGTTSLTKSVIEYPAGQRATSAELTVNAIGITSDYPFDHYTATIGVSAHDNSGPLPVSLTLDDTDPSFALSVTQDESTQGAVFLDVTLSRSRSTLIFAWLMMVIMWALALTVAAAARVQVTQRRGLTWPALGWMAATLFALTAFRNAAPGSPPVGSVLDYAAYLWAELIVAISVVVTAVAGIRAERSSSGAGNDVQLLATAEAYVGLLTGVSAAGSVNSWTGVSRRQLLAGFGGLAAAGLPATRWAAAGRAPGALIWQRRAAGTGDLVVTIFAGYGLVYENGNLQDGDDVTYAINEAGGTLAWQIGGAVEPVTAGPGVVYGFGDSGNDVVALRAATGHPLWTRNAAFPLGGPDDSTLLTYASNRLYFASSDIGAWNVTAPSTVGALDARTGRGLWSATLTARTQQPAVTDNAVYASTANGAVALNARTGAQAVLDFENAGLAEPEYDLRIFPGPDMGPGVEMLTATMHHYQALTGRALSAERIMAWHVRQALGDALWRTEAGVPLPDRLNTPIGGTCAPYMGQQPRDVVAHRQLGGCGWLSSAGSGPVPGGVGSACGPHPTAGAQQAAPGGLPWSRCGWRLVSWCCLVVPRRSGAGHPGQVGGPLGSIVPSGLRRTGVPSPVRRAVQPIWCIRM